jgi:hypothetical protein
LHPRGVQTCNTAAPLTTPTNTLQPSFIIAAEIKKRGSRHQSVTSLTIPLSRRTLPRTVRDRVTARFRFCAFRTTRSAETPRSLVYADTGATQEATTLPDIDDIFHAGSPADTANEGLGLLHDLPGRWVGKGFNLIARPARQGNPANPVFFLELNGTHETLEFTAIASDIANRGDIEPTILLHAIHYLQTVTDLKDNSLIHKEPGLWVHVPKTIENPSDTYVRQATIPHGDSLVAQSTFFTTVANGPNIQPVDSFPFPLAAPIPGLNDIAHATIMDPAYVGPYLNNTLPDGCLPKGLNPAKTIKDPTEVLRAEIHGQTITETVVIAISTAGVESGGIVNIPFVVKNAEASQMDAIFWIEKVTHPTFPHREFLQLQYVQRVILDFDNIHWPHISVATLTKSG